MTRRSGERRLVCRPMSGVGPVKVGELRVVAGCVCLECWKSNMTASPEVLCLDAHRAVSAWDTAEMCFGRAL